MTVRSLAERSRPAARRLAKSTPGERNKALETIAHSLRREAVRIETANQEDLRRSEKAGLSQAMLDRLKLGGSRLEGTAKGVEQIATMPDPIGGRSAMLRRDNGLLVGRQRVPLGVIAMIYESRPNVTVDAAALCIKSGNAVLLRGGKEAQATNAALGAIMRQALVDVDLPEDAVQIVPPGDRNEIRELVTLTDLVDLAIPRGGEGLIRFVAEAARVPIIKHYKGVCHLYLDAGCDAAMARELTVNAKTQRPGVCNALECLLVHAADARRLLPEIARALGDKTVELRGCARTCEILPGAQRAQESDWGAEFLGPILAIRVVDDFDAALEHIEAYGSHHTEAICTTSEAHARRWVDEVDASCVVVNASTRFNDGGELGLGAEIGISTSKLHAYGPMGATSLTSEKWVILGEGQTRN